MSRALMLGLLTVLSTGCASRSGGWGFPWGQGTIDRQNSRAVIHDPYPLNDIGPEVVGGRPRGYMNPLPEPKRSHVTGETGFPPGFQFPQ
ncbi:MAG: membrane or secreted protein [Aureliella sp.]